jgi:hypothetical protein
MRVKYCCRADEGAFEQYYVNQCGGGLPVFVGARMQRGHGIGSIFSGLFRSIFPIIKRVAPVIGKKALQTGVNIISDVAAGQSFKEAAKTRVTDAINEGINSFMPSGGAQSGSGVRQKRTRRGKKKAKKRKLDIFS